MYQYIYSDWKFPFTGETEFKNFIMHTIIVIVKFSLSI